MENELAGNLSATETEAGTASEKKEEEKKEEELDDEGLKSNGYDIILVGTGLTQSILASALARAGKSILHCDGNDFYGEKDSVFSLGSLLEWSTSNSTSADGTEGLDEEKTKSITGSNEDNHNASGANFITLNPKGALSSIQIQSETKSGTVSRLEKGMSVVTPYGQGIIKNVPELNTNDDAISGSNSSSASITNNNLAIKLNNWIMADGKSPMAYFGYHHTLNDKDVEGINITDQKVKDSMIAAYYIQNHDIIPTSLFQYQKYVLGQKRSFALDLTPGLLYANGDAVDAMIESGVSAYCEFKSLLGLHLFMEPHSSKMSKFMSKSTSASTSTAINKNNDSGISNQYQLSRVPCSKRDVFQTKLLSPVEKRKLMKFLQIATDYAFAKSSSIESSDDGGAASGNNNDTSETSSNSISTTGGGHNAAVEEEVVTSLNERQLQQGRSLYRPQNKTVSTSDIERLRQCIEDGMDFEKYLETEHKLPVRLRNIIVFAMAMGHNDHDGNSMYSTKNGMSDLSQHLQSLGRYGGTAFLVPLYGAGELSQAFCRSAAVHGGTYLLRRAATKVLLSGDKHSHVSSVVLSNPCSLDGDESGIEKEITARHVVVPSDAIRFTGKRVISNTRVLRRISILRGKLLVESKSGDDDGNEQRHIIIVPPNTLGNSNVIHGIVLDESVNVAPSYRNENFSTTVLHLSTVVTQGDGRGDQEDILHKTVQSLIRNQAEVLGSTDLEEIYHLGFSFNSTSHVDRETENATNGLHVCDHRSHSITVESAFREASAIFKKICPNSSFLKLSQDMDEKVKESLAGITDDDDDHEKAVLESAMDMMGSTAESDEKK
jgi:RAB protein geranylgeranyltransferase component A